MTHILQFVDHTVSDLRGGRHSWRVLTLLWTVSLCVTLTAQLLR